MAESFPTKSPFDRNSVTQGDLDFGQGDSYPLREDVEESRRVESDVVAGNPSSLGMVDEPSIQPGASFGENAEELQGKLIAPPQPNFRGGFADIFRGMWRSPDGTITSVAVKRLQPILATSMSFLPDAIALQQRREKSLKREAIVWARLRHPNIQPFLGFRTQPLPCLISQWCENGNLVNYIENNPDLSRSEKMQLLVHAARGLAFLHSQSPPICHGDIKPENVLVNDLCEAALSDFGLSRVIQESDASTGLTTGDGAKGSQRYMAPELWLELNAKPALETDVYAFGGLTLAVMSGKAPFFQIDQPAQIIFRIVSEEHPSPAEHPTLNQNDPLWSLMRRCWTLEPSMRPIMSEVKVELRRVNEPSVRLGASFREGGEELQGRLIALGTPPLSSDGYANTVRGVWRSPDGARTDVAIKTLRPIQLTSMSSSSDPIELQQRREKRLKREVAVWTALVHPNVHRLLGLRTRPEPCLVSRWCQNGNLANYLDNNPNLSRPKKLRLLVQTAVGLHFLHSQSPPICHANIKPENVLVNDLRVAALSDFGLSRVIQELDASTGSTTEDGPIGSHRYMAPELFDEENSKPTLETDVYAFSGVTLAVMSGRAPFFQIKAPEKIILRIVQGEQPKPAEHPTLDQNDPIWSLMRRCWTQGPQNRPIISDILAELREQKKLVDPLSAGRPPHRNGLTRPTTPVLPKSTQSDIEQLPSIVQPGSAVQSHLPDPLIGELIRGDIPSKQGPYSDIFKGLLQHNGVEVVVCVKALRYASMDGSCVDPNITREERFERRLKRETTIWIAAHHPNIQPFLGYRMVRGTAWLISPWASNGNLAEYLNSHDVSKLEKLTMLQGANTGLAYLHGLEPPIAHGDPKLENILVLDDLTVALCDFGTSRVVVELGLHTGMTTAWTVAGTAGYQARELILGQSFPTPASDVFAVAGTILATLSGKLPFYLEPTPASIIIAIASRRLPDPTDYPEVPADDPLWELLLECWASEPSERPSANEVVQNLQSAIQRELELPPLHTDGNIEVDLDW